MSPNRREQIFKPMLVRLFRPLDGRAWPTAAGIFLLGFIGLSTYHLWRQYSDQLLGQARYQLDPTRLEVTPQPEYIRSDVKESAVTYGRLRGASLLEKQLVLQVKQAFAVQPWVKEVLRVNKQYPSTVEVDVVYRRPVAMVEVPAGMFPPFNYDGLLPIDDEAHLLPVEIREHEVSGFPKIAGVDSSPAGPPGNPWGDTRVADAIAIILLLEEVWDSLELLKVEVPSRDAPIEGVMDRDYVLVTRQQNRFRWGPAPGKEPTGEDSAREKARGLEEFTREFGSLDDWLEQRQRAEAHVSDLLDWRRLQR